MHHDRSRLADTNTAVAVPVFRGLPNARLEHLIISFSRRWSFVSPSNQDKPASPHTTYWGQGLCTASWLYPAGLSLPVFFFHGRLHHYKLWRPAHWLLLKMVLRKVVNMRSPVYDLEDGAGRSSSYVAGCSVHRWGYSSQCCSCYYGLSILSSHFTL